MYICICK